jgi:seryl-tRNA synthetase
MQGLPARTGGFEAVAEALDRLITTLGGADAPEILRFPPVIDQAVLERNGYFVGFPHLAGCVHSFGGGFADHKRLLGKLLADEPASDEFAATGCALTPSACYPIYPLIAARGVVPADGVLIDAGSWCFRHEPSDDPARLQSFRMREYVLIGSPGQVKDFRADWLARAGRFIEALGLTGQLAPAHDPFFGTGGAALAAGQVANAAKHEMLVPIAPGGRDVACMSMNDHGRHFAAVWSLRTPDGNLAHSACIGFGIERLVLALLSAHGEDARAWPEPVRQSLWPTT